MQSRDRSWRTVNQSDRYLTDEKIRAHLLGKYYAFGPAIRIKLSRRPSTAGVESAINLKILKNLSRSIGLDRTLNKSSFSSLRRFSLRNSIMPERWAVS